jgi:serine/threonine-protein kinase
MLERFGPYRLVRRLATGGMAEVFLARQFGIEGFEREVVIKRILPHRAQDAEFCTMFLDEARLIARLNHPFVAQIYDLGQEDGTYFIAMEHVHGVDLSRLLDSAGEQGTPGLPMAVAVSIIASLCQALEYIHTRADELGHPLNIVHRDLNPKNVIVSYDGAVKLIDFGIAKAASQVYETRTGVIKGTYGYMAPEQVTRQHAIDRRADLFSLGVLTYELTTGIHPFDAPDEVAVLGKLVRCQYQPPSRKIRTYPKPLERLITGCMSLDPRDRPRSAADVLSMIEDYSLERRIPLTMSRIAEYVQRNHAAGSEPLTRVPAPIESTGDSTAMISRRLADRADQEIGTLATSLLRAPSGLPAQRGEAGGARPSAARDKPSPSRPAASPRRQWPWASWGRRERVVASAAAAVALVATVASAVLLVAAFRPTDAPAVDPSGDVHASLTKNDAPAADTVEPEPSAAEPIVAPEVPTNLLPSIRVASEPENASIFVEGTATGDVTPATVSVPAGKTLVWIRVELDGYRPDERQVAAEVGEVVFDLNPAE